MPLAPLLFVHIPKTAGSTLHSLLCRHYRRSRILATVDPRDPLITRPDSPGTRSPFDLIVGHCPVGTHEVLPEIKYASCVRDPVKRITSHYYYAKSYPDHYLNEVIHKKKMSLQDYAESDLTSELSNGMVRMLCGVSDFRACEIDQSVYEQTIEIIKEHFVFITATERFDESLLVLQKLLGISTPYYVRKKVGKYPAGRSEVTPGVIESINERNVFDQRLYQYVNDFIDREVEKFGITPEKVQEFSIKNKRFGKAIVYAQEAVSRLTGGRKVHGTSC